MKKMSENVGVGNIEAMGFTAGDLLYRTILRDLIIEKLDDPAHIYDDRILAMADGAFGYEE
jgi:hypothetical protein